MNPESPVSAENQPYAGVSEFELPDRTRELATRIIWDLIDPCRQQLANAEKRRSDAIKLADQALASVEAKFSSVRDEQNAKLRQVLSSVSVAIGELNTICAAAEGHLKSEGVAVPVVASPIRSESEASDAQTIDLAAVLDGIASKRVQRNNLCERKKIEYWPKVNQLRWGLVILSVFLFFQFKPLVFLLPAIVFVTRLVFANNLKSEYTELVEGSQKLQFMLQALESRFNKDAEGVIRASSDKLIPPAKQIHSETVNSAKQRLKNDVQKIGNDFLKVAQALHEDVDKLCKERCLCGSGLGFSNLEKLVARPVARIRGENRQAGNQCR